MLARLLATENIRVEHNASAETAMFDIKNRVLVLPVWDSMTESMYDMLVGHEVSHALHTPMDEWDEATKDMFVCQRRNFMQVCNVVEDARIERLIKDRFPGLKRDFSKAYTELHDRDLFEITGKDLSEMSLIDRLNLEFKLGLFGLVQVPFSADERTYVTRMADTKTFADVLELATDLFNDWKDDQDQQQQQQDENGENAINGDSDDSADGESQDGASESQESQDGAGESQEQCDCAECKADRESKKSSSSEQGDADDATEGGESQQNSDADGDADGGTEPSGMKYEDYQEGGTVGGP